MPSSSKGGCGSEFQEEAGAIREHGQSLAKPGSHLSDTEHREKGPRPKSEEKKASAMETEEILLKIGEKER